MCDELWVSSSTFHVFIIFWLHWRWFSQKNVVVYFLFQTQPLQWLQLLDFSFLLWCWNTLERGIKAFIKTFQSKGRTSQFSFSAPFCLFQHNGQENHGKREKQKAIDAPSVCQQCNFQVYLPKLLWLWLSSKCALSVRKPDRRNKENKEQRWSADWGGNTQNGIFDTKKLASLQFLQSCRGSLCRGQWEHRLMSFKVFIRVVILIFPKELRWK